MYRTYNIYEWKNLRHWTTALENGKITFANKGKVKECGDKELENALKLLQNDCFPIAILCIYHGKNKYGILLTPLWKSIFCYLNNERKANINGKTAYFSDITDDEQRKILKASIFAIWMSD